MSTIVVTGSTGATTTSRPKRWAPLVNAGWAVSGQIICGRATPRSWAMFR